MQQEYWWWVIGGGALALVLLLLWYSSSSDAPRKTTPKSSYQSSSSEVCRCIEPTHYLQLLTSLVGFKPGTNLPKQNSAFIGQFLEATRKVATCGDPAISAQIEVLMKDLGTSRWVVTNESMMDAYALLNYVKQACGGSYLQVHFHG
jgi:hypothetical protein